MSRYDEEKLVHFKAENIKTEELLHAGIYFICTIFISVDSNYYLLKQICFNFYGPINLELSDAKSIIVASATSRLFMAT